MRVLAHLLAVLLLGLAGSAATYTLRWGDTLGSVARAHRVSVPALAAANGITDPHRVREGQVLTIPGSPAGPAAPASTYVVRAGETLGSIAKRHGTTVANLVAANGLGDANRIQAGAVLRVAGAAAANWVCPVNGSVRFIDDFGAGRGSRSHEGVDLLAARGTSVVANVSGVVAHHDNPRGGLAYYLEGDDGVTYYGAHLDSFIGPPGRVSLGQLIGTVGDSGNARGGPTHLHFERITAAPTNPYGFLAKACPRG